MTMDNIGLKAVLDRAKAENPDFFFVNSEHGFTAWESEPENIAYADPAFTIKVKKGGVSIVSGDFEITDEERKAIKVNWRNTGKQLAYRSSERDAPAIDGEFAKFADWPRIAMFDHMGNFTGYQLDGRSKPGSMKYGKLWLVQQGESGSKLFWDMKNPAVMPLCFTKPDKETSDSVILVEGPGKAEHLRKLIRPETTEEKQIADNHPWAEDFAKLRNFRIASIYGVNSVAEIDDWKSIDKPDASVFLFLDNDTKGTEATSKIVKTLNKAKVYKIDYDERFFAGWDICDEVPESVIEQKTSLLDMFLWQSLIVNKGALTDQASREFAWIADQENFISRTNPTETYSKECFNTYFGHLRDKNKGSALFNYFFQSGKAKKYRSATYDPSGKIEAGKINTYRSSDVKPWNYSADTWNDDIRPWNGFLERLIDVDTDRKEVERWIATLLTQKRKTGIALVLISKTQGTGKSTLAKITSTILGAYNVSEPDEAIIMDKYNAWAVQKQLVVVQEIYQGRSWKAYNKLKPLITDDTIQLRKMYSNPVDFPNHASFILCSNSMDALKIEDTDRRLLIPRVTDDVWQADGENGTKAFYDWLENQDGYSKVLTWAERYGDYLEKGERAPKTSIKDDIIEGQKSSEHLALQKYLDGLITVVENGAPKGKFNDKGEWQAEIDAVIISSGEMIDQAWQGKQTYVTLDTWRGFAVKCGWIDVAKDKAFKAEINAALKASGRGPYSNWTNALAGVGQKGFYPILHPDLKDVIIARIKAGEFIGSIFKDLHWSNVKKANRDAANNNGRFSNTGSGPF